MAKRKRGTRNPLVVMLFSVATPNGEGGWSYTQRKVAKHLRNGEYLTDDHIEKAKSSIRELYPPNMVIISYIGLKVKQRKGRGR